MCKHVQRSTAGKAVGISWQRPAYALAVGTIEWPQLDLRVTFLDDPCCWHIGDRMPFYFSSPAEATGSHWEGVVGQNVCLRLVNRWGLILPDVQAGISLFLFFKQRPPWWVGSYPVELTEGQRFRHTTSSSQGPPCWIFWEQVQILDIAWSFHWRSHFIWNVGTKKNLNKKQKTPILQK